MISDEIRHIFRAYDIRGIYGKTLFPDIIVRASAIFANIINEKVNGKLVAVSGDARTSSKILIAAAAAGIAGAGLDVYLMNAMPLPIFNYFIWSEKKVVGGAYVTASHNPPEWNGIRFRWGDGTGFAEDNQEIKKRFFKDTIKWAEWGKIGTVFSIDRQKILSDYLNFVFELDPQPERKLRVVLDMMNSIGGIVVPLLHRETHEVITLNSQVDGFFPAGAADPVHGDISKLLEAVVKYQADVGIAFDGDTDRALVVDDKGRKVPAEIVGIILARELLKSGDVVVYNAECASILKNKLEEIGIKAIETRVGDVFVAKYAKEHRAKIGVESSYHFFVPLYGFYYDDAILATYVLASILSKYKKPLSEIIDDIGHFYVIRENVKVDDEKKWEIIEYLKETFRSKFGEISTIDGVKVYLENGSVLIRPSNTEPVIRITSEATSENLVSSIHKEFKKYLENAIEKVK